MTTLVSKRRYVASLCAVYLLSGISYAQLSKPIALNLNDASGAAATFDSGTLQYHQKVVQGKDRAGVWKSEVRPDLTPSGGAGLGPGLPSNFNLVVYPGFLSNPNNNPVLHTAAQHPVYVNSPTLPNPATHWGDPDVFLDNLAGSAFIHVVDHMTLDPYYPTVRYPLGAQYMATGATPHILHMSNLTSLLHTLGLQGNGYHHLYHIFLPQGQDFCFDAGNTDCYSPDMPNSWTFCAFHSAATFNDAAGHVVFSVEPFQNVAGCRVTGLPSPNGQLTDSTASTLSHETFEAITDPDLNAWYNRDNLDLGGAENGDQCQSRSFNYGFVLLKNFRFYEIQSEYSNLYNGCTYQP